MLKKFILQTLSSFVGAWIAIALFGIVAVIVATGLVARLTGDEGGATVKNNSVLCLDLTGEIIETEESLKPDYNTLLSGDLKRPQTLSTIVKALGEASENKNISMLYIRCGAVSGAPATLDAIRHEVENFKQSGKKVYAYGEVITNGDYYVASVADSIFLNPGGELYLKGLGSTSLYMKSLFDKLGVTFQVVKVGTFKSAVEPYIMDEMSGPARAQLDTLFGTMWGYMKNNISKSRKGITPEAIDSAINRDYIFFAPAADALKGKFIDALAYGREVKTKLASAVGVEEKDLNIVSPSDLVSQTAFITDYSAKNQIAVLYATGEIVDGASGGINHETLVPQIVELADDENIKGMVLRVNSPGGSAFGSEQIGEALDYFMSKGKPLSVSMGDYAASGGYWISCGADRIFADALTITGSIGIFGLIPNVAGLTDKLGVYPQTVETNPGTNFPSFFKPMDEKQKAVMQRYVDRGYENFVGRVAKGRKMKVEAVKRIAEGRVWSALTAVKLGLVDSIGYIKDAVEWTAGKASLGENYQVTVYPKYEPSFWDMLPAGGNMVTTDLLDIARGNYDAVMIRFAKSVLNRKPIQMRMPPVDVKL